MTDTITSYIIKQKKLIIWIYRIAYLFLILSIATFKWTKPYWLDIGRQAGDIAVIFFTITILPGILSRLKATGFLQQIQTSLMLFRRQNGILMFLFALTHYTYIRILPIIFQGSIWWKISIFEWLGISAFLLSAALFITSNNYSQRLLGPKWAKLHKLVYLITWLIFLHLVFMQRANWATSIILIISVLEITSILIKKSRLQRPAINSPTKHQL